MIMIFWRRPKSLTQLNPKLEIRKLRKLTKILIVDDEKDSFPIESLQNNGYTIEHWPEVKDLEKLVNGDFDIIVLDIKGVAASICKEDGFGILEHIKQRNPSQIVIAFSGQNFDIGKSHFFKMADDVLCKPALLVECTRMLDAIIESKITVSHYWESICEMLCREGATPKQIASIENRILKAITKGQRSSVSELQFSDIAKHANTAVTCASLALKIFELTGQT